MSALRREGAWAVVDQVLSSGTNFIPAVLLARFLGPDSFGAFSLAFLAWFGALSIMKSALMEPYTLMAADADASTWRDVTGRAAGATILAGAVGSLIFGLTALVVSKAEVRAAFWVLALLSPALALQEFWRVACYAASRARAATLNDACWAGGQVIAFGAIVLWRRHLTVEASLLAWGSGAVVAALLGAVQLGVVPRVSLVAARWAREIGGLALWFTLSNGIFAVGMQGVALVVAFKTGTSGLGLFRATQNLFGPIQLLTIGLQAVFLPHVVRHLRRGGRQLKRSARYSLVVAGSVAGYGVAAILGAHLVLVRLFGPAYGAAGGLVLPMVVAFVLDAAGSGAEVELRARGLGRKLVAAQALSTIARVIAVILLAAAGGLRGAAWGLAIGSAVAAVSWWVQALRADAVSSGVKTHAPPNSPDVDRDIALVPSRFAVSAHVATRDQLSV